MRRSLLAALAAFAALLAPAAASAQTAYTSYVRYDAMGRVTGTITPVQPYNGLYLAVRNTYDSAGRLIRVQNGRLTVWNDESVAPANWTGFGSFQMTEIEYDMMGRKVRENLFAEAGSSLTSVTQYSYDNMGRVTCTAVRMNPAVYGSLPSSACTPSTTGSNGPDRISRNVYDAAGQRIQLRVGVGSDVEAADATWDYNQAGQVVTMIDGNGNRATLRYDGHGRQDRWTFPSTTRPTSFNDATQATALSTAGSVNSSDYEGYGYDANGNRTSLRKRDGSTLTYSYDFLNRLTLKTVPERPSPHPYPLASAQTRDVYYGYDLRGLQLYARFDSHSGEGVANVYDGFGRLTSSAIDMGSVTRALQYRYDRNGNRVRITHPDGVWFQQDYDQLNRPSWLSHQGTAGLIYINRDDDGRPANINRDTGSAAYFTYDTARRVTGMSFDLPGTANDVAWTYGYNPARQIASVTRNNDNYAWTGHYAVTRPYTTNGLNQYTAAGGASFSYDANGNLTGDGARTFLFDVENRLVEVRTGSTVNGAIVYDPLGRIFSYAAGSSTRVFLYDGDALVAEYNPSASNVMTARYVHGVGADVPYAWYDGAGLNDLRFLYGDHQGSIVAVVGTSVSINRYDEYGIPQGTISGRFAYTGQIYLPEIGLYHYKARVYSPTLGRFLQVDPIGYEGGENLYAYVGNDPVNRTDPTGLQQCCRYMNEERERRVRTWSGSRIGARAPSAARSASRSSGQVFRDGSAGQRGVNRDVGQAAIAGGRGALWMLKEAAAETNASAADLRPFRVLGGPLTAVSAAISYSELRDQGHSRLGATAGAAASEGTTWAFTAGGAFLGSYVLPPIGTIVGAGVGYGIDHVSGASDVAGNAAANGTAQLQNGGPSNFAHRVAGTALDHAYGRGNDTDW